MGTLTHWGRVTHICVSKQTIIGSDNGLSPVRRQAIIWTNAGILLMGPLGTKFNEILIEIHTTSAVPDCSTNHDSADCISVQFLFYHNHNFTKSKGNLRFQRLVPLFVPIGVCVTTHDDGTASDVTIGMRRHNQQATNHEHNGKPWFHSQSSLAMQFASDDMLLNEW